MGGHPGEHPGPFVLVADVEAPVLAADDDHHLRRVLRLRPGSALTIGDGHGRWRTGRLGDELEPTGPVEQVAAPPVLLTVGFALVKGDKPELVVQKLTEIGVDRIVPFRAERSVVRWDEAKAGKAVERLRLVARAAAMQSHRPHLPEVAAVVDLADLAVGPGIALAGRGGGELGPHHHTVLVGPEGGWSAAELGLGLPTIGLGDHVLRAETAAIAAAVLLADVRRRSDGCPPSSA